MKVVCFHHFSAVADDFGTMISNNLAATAHSEVGRLTIIGRRAR